MAEKATKVQTPAPAAKLPRTCAELDAARARMQGSFKPAKQSGKVRVADEAALRKL